MKLYIENSHMYVCVCVCIYIHSFNELIYVCEKRNEKQLYEIA